MAGGRADSVMRCETDDFLRNMPPGLQARQEKAVRMAVAGNSAALDEVRFSRNHAIEIAEGVEVMDIDTDYRLYKPAYCNGKILPVMIYLHGGGWCFGSINSCARFCIELVKTAGIAVLAVDYPWRRNILILRLLLVARMRLDLYSDMRQNMV